MRLIADTTVLVHLWRLRREPARLEPLRRLLSCNEPYLPWMVLFEFARGLFLHGRTKENVEGFLADFTPVIIDEAQVYQAARIAADLQRTGRSIGVCDVWIAAASLEEEMPVLTANGRHFERIQGVQTLSYSLE